MGVSLLVLVLLWAVTRANAGHHLSSLGSQNCSSSFGTTTPNIFSVPTDVFLRIALHPVCDLPCHRVGKSPADKGLQRRRGKAEVKFWSGEEKEKAWD